MTNKYLSILIFEHSLTKKQEDYLDSNGYKFIHYTAKNAWCKKDDKMSIDDYQKEIGIIIHTFNKQNPQEIFPKGKQLQHSRTRLEDIA